MHFFVLNPNTFKQGQHDSLSSDSSGSTQHYLLLDEFYRSSLLLTGRYPLWWLVPPEHESNDEEYVDELVANRKTDRDDFIDFGGLGDIPANEILDAAVWQRNKSWHESSELFQYSGHG